MKMQEGLETLYRGNEGFSRQVMLFSICGIVGLFDAYLSSHGFETLTILEKVLFMILWILFGIFMVGYEVIYLKERELPDIDFRPFKLAFKKPLIYLLLIIIPLSFSKILPEQYVKVAFLLEMLLAVPLTMIQAGFSYNFDYNEAFKLFETAKIKDYLILFLKRIGLIFLAYFIVGCIVFFLFFIFGFYIAVTLKGNAESILLTITSIQHIISKLAGYVSGILIIYILTNITLIWDYELIKTYESEERWT